MTGLDATRYYVCASVLLSLISNQRLYRWDEGEMPMADLNTIREILLQHWDPIGVGDAPDAVDEYDHYAIKILQMLEAEEGRDRIEAYLGSVTVDRMGLRITGTLHDSIKRTANLLWHDLSAGKKCV